MGMCQRRHLLRGRIRVVSARRGAPRKASAHRFEVRPRSVAAGASGMRQNVFPGVFA